MAAMTVLGKINANELGVTLPHEHIVWNGIPALMINSCHSQPALNHFASTFEPVIWYYSQNPKK